MKNLNFFRAVHFESDRSKREKICEVLPKACFPGWFEKKRKYEN